MMWVMALACALPILISVFVGSGRSNRVVWVLLGVGAMMLFHWLIMRLFHQQTSDTADSHPSGDRNTRHVDDHQSHGPISHSNERFSSNTRS